MRMLNKSVVTKIRYEDAVKDNKILINKSICNKKKIRSCSLNVILIIFFHFDS